MFLRDPKAVVRLHLRPNFYDIFTNLLLRVRSPRWAASFFFFFFRKVDMFCSISILLSCCNQECEICSSYNIAIL
jgi:hypothetical protein